MLGVQIAQFQNLYNAEIKNGRYCCCDDGPCEDDIRALKNVYMTDCTNPCETYFIVKLQDCTSNTHCTGSQTFNLEDDSTSGLSSVIFYIPFGKTVQVRAIYISYLQTN